MTTFKASILQHHLWVVEPYRGCWCLCITGDKPIRENSVFAMSDDAMRTAHSLAHWYIEGKHFCDCEEGVEVGVRLTRTSEMNA